MKDYMGELAHGGYSLSWRQQTLSDALKGYERIWSMEVKGTGKVNRSDDMTINKRRAQMKEINKLTVHNKGMKKYVNGANYGHG